MRADILKFDTGLIGISFNNGYRITLRNQSDVNRMNIINFLSEYGEGYYDGESYKADEWYFKEDIRHCINIVIVDSDDKLKSFCEYFNIQCEIDESYTIENRIMKILKPYLFELITQKLKNKIREDIRIEFNIKPYDIKFYDHKIEIDKICDGKIIIDL